MGQIDLSIFEEDTIEPIHVVNFVSFWDILYTLTPQYETDTEALVAHARFYF